MNLYIINKKKATLSLNLDATNPKKSVHINHEDIYPEFLSLKLSLRIIHE